MLRLPDQRDVKLDEAINDGTGIGCGAKPPRVERYKARSAVMFV